MSESQQVHLLSSPMKEGAVWKCSHCPPAALQQQQSYQTCCPRHCLSSQFKPFSWRWAVAGLWRCGGGELGRDRAIRGFSYVSIHTSIIYTNFLQQWDSYPSVLISLHEGREVRWGNVCRRKTVAQIKTLEMDHLGPRNRFLSRDQPHQTEFVSLLVFAQHWTLDSLLHITSNWTRTSIPASHAP